MVFKYSFELSLFRKIQNFDLYRNDVNDIQKSFFGRDAVRRNTLCRKVFSPRRARKGKDDGKMSCLFILSKYV